MSIPRRSNKQTMTEAELAILEAMYKVEDLPPDTRLTEAVTLLGEAKDKVSDYVDGVAEDLIDSGETETQGE